MGHGPSILEKRLGREIDGYDAVIRQKRCAETLKHPHHFGTKTTAVCGSWTIAGQLPQVPAHEYWAFLDSRHEGVTEAELAHAGRLGFKVLPAICRHWNQAYLRRRTPFTLWTGTERKATSDDLGHTHMSAGLHTLIYACELLEPKHIDLIAFDNVKAGGFTWSVTRGPGWNQYPDHRWDIERELVPIIADHYGVEIEYI